MDEAPLHIVILAAGAGKRMHSDLPKVLLPVGGRPMLAHVLDTAKALQPAAVHVVHGHGGEQVRSVFASEDIHWVAQAEQLGTGHAVMQALPAIPDDARVLVLCGDTPLVPVAPLHELLRASDRLSLLSMRPADAAGYGRVVRDADDRVKGIVEEKDATAGQRNIQEVNTGVLAAPAGTLRSWLQRVGQDNRQQEYYLTDVITIAAAEGVDISAHVVADATRMAGANDRWQLAQLERRYQQLKAQELCEAGITVMDPSRLDIRGTVQAGRGVVLDVNVILEGDVALQDNVHIGPNCLLRDARIEAGTRVLANSVVEGASIGARCRIGPFARIRPGTEAQADTAVGNFVEVKQSRIGAGSKVNHLSYIGDTDIGGQTNIGAGTITCNYDGAAKHKTVIGSDVFIGSNAALIAPVTINDGATIGAGSVIAQDAPAGKLTLTRPKQATVEGWQRKKKVAQSDKEPT